MEGQRICFKDAYGTVRWHGTIEGKEGNWVGIEWDDPARGKHSGAYQGVQYFYTKFPETGSFIKESLYLEDLVPGVEILFAISDKYADKTVQDFSNCYAQTVKNLKKQIELIAPEKIQKRQEQLASLTEIALQSRYISAITPHFGESIISCEILLLDQNLLNSWNQVSMILSEIPQLHTLSLASNRIEGSLTEFVSHSLQILVLNNMALQWGNLLPVLDQFHSLSELHLFKNFCNDFVIPHGMLASLKMLNLEDNQISSWGEVSRQFGHLPSLEKLIINSNPIGNIVHLGGFERLFALSVENCNLNDWRSVDEMGKFGLKEIRIGKNEILIGTSSLTLFRFNVVARIGDLTMMNGSNVRAQERLEAERYFLRSHIGNPSIVHSFRWNELVQKHGPPDEISCNIVSEQDMLSQQTLNSNSVTLLLRSLSKSSAGKELKKKLLLNMTVSDLKVMCSKLFGVQTNQLKISFRDKNNIMPEFMEDPLKAIGYYILNDQGEIWIEDIN